MLSTLSAFVITNSASAVTVVVGLSEGDASFNSIPGTPGAFTDSGFGASRTFTYEVNDLDLAADGSANDTAVFSLNFTSTSGVAGAGVAVTNTGNAEASFGVGPNPNFGNFDVNEIDGGETLTVSALIPIVTLGDGQVLNSAVFNGFLDLETFFVNADPNNTLMGATVGGNASLPGSANGSSISFDALSTGPITFGGDPTGNGFYVGNFSQSYTFDVVPEPTSAVLLGFAAVGMVARRRR